MASAGIGAGAFAEGFLKSYSSMKDLQDRAATREQQQKLIDMQLQKYQDEKDQQTALQETYSNTIGQVGKPSLQQAIATNTGVGPQQAASLASAGNSGDAEFDKALAQSDIGVLNQNAQRQGRAIPAQVPVVPSAPSPEQAKVQYVNSIMGNPKINPKEALAIQAQMQQMDLGQYQLNEAKRQDKLNTAYDQFREDLKPHFTKLANVNPDSAESVAGDLGPIYEQFNPGHAVSFDKKTNSVLVAQGDGKAPLSFTPQQALANARNLLLDYQTQGSMAFAANQDKFFTQHNEYTKTKQQGEYQTGVLGVQGREAKVKEREVAVKEAVAPSEISKNKAYESYLTSGGAGNKPSVKTVSVDMGTDANGKKLGKQTYTQIIKLSKDGEPVVSVYDAAGKKINDPDLVGRVSNEAGNSQETALPAKDSKFEMMRKKVLENKDLDTDSTLAELNKIDTMEKLPAPGGTLNPNAGKAKPTALPSQTSGSHTPVDQQKSAIPSTGVNKEVIDINNRLKLQGISDETKKQLIARRNEILGLPGPTSSLAPNYLNGVK